MNGGKNEKILISKCAWCQKIRGCIIVKVSGIINCICISCENINNCNTIVEQEHYEISHGICQACSNQVLTKR